MKDLSHLFEGFGPFFYEDPISSPDKELELSSSYHPYVIISNEELDHYIVDDDSIVPHIVADLKEVQDLLKYIFHII
jgi:hypothetical protein